MPNKPAFNPEQSYSVVSKPEKPAFDPSQPSSIIQPSDEPSALSAFGTAAARGATFDFWDEIKAALMSGEAGPEREKRYQELLQKYRGEQKAAEEAHPYASMAGQVAGSLPYMAVPGVGAAKEASLASQVAKQNLIGGVIGGLTGAGQGEDAESRLKGAAISGGIGSIVGAATPVVSKIGSAIYDKTLKPAVDVAKGYFKPDEMVSKTIATALKEDQKLIEAGKIKGLTLQDWQAAKAAGEPVTLADLGGPNTKELINKVSSHSPEAMADLENVFENRFRTQAERVSSDVRRLTGNEANASRTSDQLRETYDTFRNQDYRNAFTQPSAQFLWDENLQSIAQSPTVRDAMRGAFFDAKEHAAKFELPVPETYNLQFWDNVKKQLDKINTNDSRYWAEKLRNYLDTIVPEYKQARGFAASYFNANDALEAGQKLAGKKIETAELKKILNKMIPEEQDLFKEGYASDLSERIIKNMPLEKDLTKAIYHTPGERERIYAIFGPEGARKLEARMALETIMEGSRKALGNSAQAKNLLTDFLTSGALGLGSWKAALVKGAASMATKKARERVNKDLAEKAARLLTSDNPDEYRQGYELVIKNEKLMNGIKDLANTLMTVTAAKSLPETEKSRGGSVTDKMHMARGGRKLWTSYDETWQSLDPYQKAAVMSLMEADDTDPEDAKHILGAMVNRAARDKQDLGKHVSQAIYQPTFESKQHKRLTKLLEHPALPELTQWVQRRSQGLEPDIVGGATHYLAHEPVMLALQKKEPNKYRSWVDWTEFNPETKQYGNVMMRDKSHAFLAPEGKYSAPYRSEEAMKPLAMIADRGRDQAKLMQMAAAAAEQPIRPTPQDQTALVRETATPQPVKPKLTPEQEMKFLQAITGFMKGQEELPVPVAPLAAPEIPRAEIPVVMPYGKAKGGTVTEKMKRAQLAKACWPGYEAIGTKKKGKKTVPNCVPISKKKNG